ncbi:3-oxoacyl-[acyl-carrier-protein] reductase FabG (plasmid) [Sulfitobacter indolifex]|uniref:Short-chain dehydrogenase/reductase SDR n=1 Tax=Sulfitobacter indolifex HEL-45 TaxID=391624 RepID=A0ABM9X092_9RHOB|nr:SDR family oxidoreductase [Sulfitobacter indolifex]EDQ02885.1 Short-chain dehydrogenase/reductase SDR [Sulfitobacter indolifex HEL-45]UOA20616.1 3-oxoacyl-[acyl-carrier-protein] reductase FabG [Sulfitobacter indolifex]UOA20815.1 3-oxoacyl-[acyl-carrier-protein] reductase FabG [Sulfitobacter indolifex]
MTRPVAIVTGAAIGIGQAVAARLLADGFSLVACDLQDFADSAEHRHDVVADVAAAETPERLCRIADGLGPLAVLVNNAGIGGAQSVSETEDDRWAQILDVNLGAAMRLSRAALPAMISEGEGSIVHMASVYGQLGFRTTAAYAASKAGLEGLTRQMAGDYGPHGIRVNAVAPGLINTDLTRGLLKDPIYRQLMIHGTPLPGPGLPEDVAGAVSFLCSSDARFVSGITLNVDGGWATTRTNHSHPTSRGFPR